MRWILDYIECTVSTLVQTLKCCTTTRFWRSPCASVFLVFNMPLVLAYYVTPLFANIQESVAQCDVDQSLHPMLKTLSVEIAAYNLELETVRYVHAPLLFLKTVVL